MRTPLEIIKELADHRCDGDDGFESCPHCSAHGWGFIEHDAGCAMREARALLGQCPHGYPSGYRHSGESCKAETYTGGKPVGIMESDGKRTAKG